ADAGVVHEGLAVRVGGGAGDALGVFGDVDHAAQRQGILTHYAAGRGETAALLVEIVLDVDDQRPARLSRLPLAPRLAGGEHDRELEREQRLARTARRDEHVRVAREKHAGDDPRPGRDQGFVEIERIDGANKGFWRLSRGGKLAFTVRLEVVGMN